MPPLGPKRVKQKKGTAKKAEKAEKRLKRGENTKHDYVVKDSSHKKIIFPPHFDPIAFNSTLRKPPRIARRSGSRGGAAVRCASLLGRLGVGRMRTRCRRCRQQKSGRRRRRSGILLRNLRGRGAVAGCTAEVRAKIGGSRGRCSWRVQCQMC